MLTLRIINTRELPSGMSESKVSKMATILSDLNPLGEAIEPRYIKQRGYLRET